MCGVKRLAMAAVLAASAAFGAQNVASDAATAVLAKSREAVGGDKKLALVKTVVATGRTRQVRGDNLVPIEFEIAIELPDRYVRKDEIPAQESGPTTVGFNGSELIQYPAPSGPPMPARAGAPPPTPAQAEAARKARLTTVKHDFVRLALGLFAGSLPGVPLTFTYVAKAEAPQGKADVLDVKGPDNFAARFFVSDDTHLPIMVSWQGGPPPGARGAGPGGRGPAGPPPEGTARAAAGPPGSPPESRIYYADYRDVDGLKLPFRLRRAVGADTIEETTFDGFKINSKIDPKKFEVRK